MKEIVLRLREFVEEDLHPWVYGCTLLFITAAIALNYQFDFEDSILDSYQMNWWAYGLYLIYFFVPYFFVIACYAVFQPEFKQQLTKAFWVKSIFGIALLALKVWFFYHLLLTPEQGSWQERFLFSKISNRIVNISFYALGILGFYFYFEQHNKNLYGLAEKEFNWKPYIYLLAIMVFPILWASFQADFLEAYPRLQFKYVTENYWQWFAVFEPLYLAEFIGLEWFFRGFLVVGMVQIIGKKAVLPMAVLYCVFHFGKPMGECIGSLFGGYILGAIAYSTRSVWGGIIVHMGIAFLMDLFAIAAHQFWA